MPVRACVGYCAPVRPLVPLTPRLTHPAPSRDILLLPIVTHPTRARLEPVAALRGTSPPGSPARRRSGSGAIVPLVIFLFWLFSVFRPTGSHHCVFYPISVYPGMPLCARWSRGRAVWGIPRRGVPPWGPPPCALRLVGHRPSYTPLPLFSPAFGSVERPPRSHRQPRYN